MKFFTEYNVDKSSKIGITSLLSNITQKPGSHKGGWARLLKCQLKNAGYDKVSIVKNGENLDQFNVIIFDLGAEYSGTLNLFGGLDQKCYERTLQIFNFKGMLFSWRHELPNLVTTIQGRLTNKSTYAMFLRLEFEDFIMLGQRLASTQVFDHVYKTNKLLIGDSHTPSVWTPEYMIERRDGRTLKGMIEKQTLQKYVQKMAHIDHIMVHCGAIDIRHHVARESNPDLTIYKLAQNLILQIATFGFTSVVIPHTVGIEDESRDLPKTGFFKGTPFFGSWEVRNRLRDIFDATIEEAGSEYGFEIIKLPSFFFDEAGKMKMEFMEVPGSVHTSPEYYRWDLDLNKNRWGY